MSFNNILHGDIESALFIFFLYFHFPTHHIYDNLKHTKINEKQEIVKIVFYFKMWPQRQIQLTSYHKRWEIINSLGSDVFNCENLPHYWLRLMP